MPSLFADLAAACPAVTAGRRPPGLPPRSTLTPIRTRPFLDLVAALLPVLAALGRGLAPARADVSKNLARLAAAAAAAAPPGALDGDVRLIAAAELAAVGGDAAALHGSTSAAKALLWLVRTLAFVAGVLRGVASSEGGDGRGARPPALGAVAREAYAATLRPYHGSVTGAAVSAALAFAPGRASFWAAVGCEGAGGGGGGGGGGDGGGGAATAAEVAAFLAAFDPILAQLQAYLTEAGLDDPTPVR